MLYGDRSAARRAAARQHHPDVGGSAAALAEAFAAIDRVYGVRGSADSVPTTFVHRTLADQTKALAVAAALRSIMAIRIICSAGHFRGTRHTRSTHLEDQP